MLDRFYYVPVSFSLMLTSYTIARSPRKENNKLRKLKLQLNAGEMLFNKNGHDDRVMDRSASFSFDVRMATVSFV